MAVDKGVLGGAEAPPNFSLTVLYKYKVLLAIPIALPNYCVQIFTFVYGSA